MIIENGVLKKIEKEDIITSKFIVEDKNIKIIGESSFMEMDIEEIVLPDNIEIIEDNAFLGCNNLKRIRLPKNLKSLGKGVFCECSRLEEIEIPDNIEEIEYAAFENCYNLKKIKLNEGLKKIGRKAFYKCSMLESINLPSTVSEIGDSAFRESGIKEITIPNKVRKISTNCFNGCERLVNVNLSKRLISIEESAFFDCSNLQHIDLPLTLQIIGEWAFYDCRNLEKIKIPSRVVEIKKSAFEGNVSLNEVELSYGLKYIGDNCFQHCGALKSIDIPDSVISLGGGAFLLCNNLEKVRLSNNLKSVYYDTFKYCFSLRKIEIPSSVETIYRHAFYNCDFLEEVIFNEGLKRIHSYAFGGHTSLTHISLPKSEKKVDSEIFGFAIESLRLYHTTSIEAFNNFENLEIVNANTNESVFLNDGERYQFIDSDVVMLSSQNHICFYDINDNWVIVNKVDLNLYNKDNKIKIANYNKLYEWVKRGKFLPHYSIIENMPLKEMNNFYINNNPKRWKSLITLANIDLDEEKEAFFPLCYCLGLFNESSSVSERAYEFIKKEIIPNVNHGEYHVSFGGLDVYNNGYDEEFARLVFKYYSSEERNDGFLQLVLASGSKVNYFSAVYNNFNKIKKAYPNKRVNTNREVDELTPKLCLDVIKSADYDNIDSGNEEFAMNVSTYGYTQAEFERAQYLFNIGKNIAEDEILLVIDEDDDKEYIQYELLDKSDPLGVILGNITNCCQTINGVGKECLEYGLSKRNSKFIVFRIKEKIIGQSWVWYDEIEKKICFDNIEIPTNVLKNELSEDRVKKEFIKCLKRSVNGFLKAMNSKGLEVESITVGEGFNDIKDILSKEFELKFNLKGLTNYYGYSDAKNQFVLYNKNK